MSLRFHFQTRASFPAWGTEFAALLFPGLGLTVADADLRGRAWGVVSRPTGVRLDLRRIEAETAPYDPPGGLLQPNFCNEALSILLHELGHAAAWNRPWLVNELPAGEAAAEIAEWTAQPEPVDVPPWHLHEANFLRATLHVCKRAGQVLGWPIDLDTVVISKEYALSPMESYRVALDDEPEHLAGEPFTAIHKTKPPPAFTRLWRQDVSAWLDGIRSPSHEQVAAATAAMCLF